MCENVVIDTIEQRTSIRVYREDKITPDKLELLVKAGMSAPSAMNVQPWEFIVVTSEKLLDKLSEVQPFVKIVKNAPAAIIVCGNMDAYNDDRLAPFKDYWVQDTSAASQNILIAATSLGIGSVWTGLYPSEEACLKVREVLDIPKDVIPLNIIVLGYPVECQEPHNKWNANKMHWDGYNP